MKDKYAVLLIVASLISSCSGSAAFVSGPRGHLHGAFRPTTKPSLYSPISMRGCSNSDKEIQIDDDAPDQSEDSLSLIKQLNLRADEILIEKERQRLEEANTQSFLKRHPWKLPYEEARRWVQANLAADTEEEFYQLVSVGCIDTPYIPKRPEEYYKRRREWISWDHFLHGCFDDKSPSGVQPATGILD